MSELLARMNEATEWIISHVLWSLPTFVVMLGVGILFTIWSRFIQFRALTTGVRVALGHYDRKRDKGALTPFQAICAALSGTVGLGNIGGVALAVSIGGPGALFWMWVVGFLGMAIKSVEVALAIIYRDMSNPDLPRGGAMHVAGKGLAERFGPRFKVPGQILGGLFCASLILASFTGGNMFQAWNIGELTRSYFKIPSLVAGVVLSAATAVVILGGIKRIGRVVEKLVPLMCLLYVAAGLVILGINAPAIPGMLATIVSEAFSPTEAQGAFLGATLWFGLTTGLRRAIFSNEAGQGTSPIVHSTVKTQEPVSEAVVAGLEPFIDTCVICTFTGLVLLCTGTWNRGSDGELIGGARVAEGRFEGPTELSALAMRNDTAWQATDRFFLIGETTDPATGEKGRARVFGGFSNRGDGGAGEIVWEAAPANLTGLVDRGVYHDYRGASLTGYAYSRNLGNVGTIIVIVTCWLFAYSTLLTWNFYGEQGVTHLLGRWAVAPYKVVYCLAIVVATWPGFIRTDRELGNLSDLGTGFMLFANIPIVLIMSPVAIRAMRDYFDRIRRGEIKPTHGPGAVPEEETGNGNGNGNGGEAKGGA